MLDLTPELIAELQTMDTPTVCNALELLVPARRGYGYTVSPLVCTRPHLKPMVGFARTATIRSAHPSDLNAADAPKPSVIVMQDIDEQRGYGSFWGEVNSSIHKGFGALGLITDGGVRDIPDIAEGFQMLAAQIIPSHAYVHVVDFSRPVNVAGMRVRDGDLIHADQHGAVVIPHEVATKVRGAADQIIRRERVIIEAARQPGFDIERLRAAQGKASEIH
jgi:regulator of RNase E activity RraA